ncbi:MAG: sulfur reduction protein DsrS [Gammaproteobacteria bacterium]
MELSSEDNFRINILLHQNAHAIRIDESKMVVFGLTEKGEAKVPLNPNCRDDKYIKKVRELISSHVLGSPGGYPVFLGRWTRMGQTKDESLEQLLLLGEPEAVVAVVHAAGISNEIARRAWWSMPTSENARRMLEKQTVVDGDMGSVLAEYLIEYLPFEVDAREMIESIRLVLQGDLINEKQKMALWSKAKRKNSFYVGFMMTKPDDIPEPLAAHPDEEMVSKLLKPCLGNESCDHYIKMLLKVHSSIGQTLLNTLNLAMLKPTNQDVVIMLLNAVSQFFKSIKPLKSDFHSIEEINQSCDELISALKNQNTAFSNVVIESDKIRESLYSVLFLSCLCEGVVNPIFSRSSAIGSVMRKKLKPVSDPILENCKNLCVSIK